MKQVLSILFIAVMLYSCGNSNQSNATDSAKQIQSPIKSGTVGTTISGYTMSAKINGKHWVASSMMPPEAAGRIISGKK